jgi:hypothetical protein
MAAYADVALPFVPPTPIKKRLARRIPETVEANMPFKKLFEFINARQLAIVKRVFPDLFQIGPDL